jgi:predicted Zn-dependent protease
MASTGHALPAPNPYGPFPTNMLMSAGGSSREELLGGLERGLLVTRFHYTNPVHPKLAIVTGMTRDGTFLVEGGRIVGPVRNLRYTQSYLEALAGTEAVAAERRTLRGFLGAVVVPAIRVASWTFTGATEH